MNIGCMSSRPPGVKFRGTNGRNCLLVVVCQVYRPIRSVGKIGLSVELQLVQKYFVDHSVCSIERALVLENRAETVVDGRARRDPVHNRKSWPRIPLILEYGVYRLSVPRTDSFCYQVLLEPHAD